MNSVASDFNISDVYKRVAVVDDVFAAPLVSSLDSELVQFWAEISSDDNAIKLLRQITGKEIRSVDDIDDEALSKIFANRQSMESIADPIEELFMRHDQRRMDVEKIVNLLKDNGFDICTFFSTDDLFRSGEFSLVFLDLYLNGGDEGDSSKIAKRIYSDYKAFVFLMSDKPGAEDSQEEFRLRSRLLKGFFSFCQKKDLCNEQLLLRRLNSLPRDTKVCHQVHDFVLSIDIALGGPLDDETQSSKLLYDFIKTLRSLALSDYAVLCELTLRDEGHPLGDYMIKLLGAYLTHRLLENSKVRDAVVCLDQMQFSEFLPFLGDATDAMKELYASSLTETISNPWGNHPWEPVGDSGGDTYYI
jgi:hypothetical protein